MDVDGTFPKMSSGIPKPKDSCGNMPAKNGLKTSLTNQGRPKKSNEGLEYYKKQLDF